MDTIIAVVVIACVVGFVAWKNKDKLSGIANKWKEKANDLGEPEVSTTRPEPVTPYKVEPVQPVFTGHEQPEKVNAPKYNGEGDPPSQEAWTEWRNRQPASTRFAIPEVWKPTPKDNPDFGPFPEVDVEKQTHGGNSSQRVKLSTRFVSIPIKHPKDFKGSLKVAVVESVDSPAGQSVRYILEVAGDNVAPNHYEWGYTGGSLNMNLEGASHEIRIKANKPAECFVWYGWNKK